MKLTEAGIVNSVEEEFFWHQVKKNCSDYVQMLQEYDVLNATSSLIYRGLATMNGKFGKMPISKNRKSLMATSYPHQKWVLVANNIYNQFAYMKTHIQNFRNRVVYCSMDMDEAEHYGNLCVVFPINGSKCFVEPNVDDSATVRADMFSFFWDYMNTTQKEVLRAANALTISIFEDTAKNNLSIYLQTNPAIEKKMITSFLQNDNSFKEWRARNLYFHQVRFDDLKNFDSEEVALYAEEFYYYSMTSITAADQIGYVLQNLGVTS